MIRCLQERKLLLLLLLLVISKLLHLQMQRILLLQIGYLFQQQGLLFCEQISFSFHQEQLAKLCREDATVLKAVDRGDPGLVRQLLHRRHLGESRSLCLRLTDRRAKQ